MFRLRSRHSAWVAALVLAAATAGSAHAQRIVGAGGLSRTPLQFNNGTTGGYVFFQPAYVTVGTGAVLVRPNYPANLLPAYNIGAFAAPFAVPAAAAYPYYDAYAGWGLPSSIYDPAAPGGTVDPAAVGALRFDPAAPGRTFDPGAPRIDPLLLPLQPAGTVEFTRYTAPAAPVTIPSGDPSTATFTLNVPDGAYVWVQGQQTQQTGTVREFVSPPLKPGQTYKYDVKVQWTEGDKPVEQTLTIDVTPGSRQAVSVFAPSKGKTLEISK